MNAELLPSHLSQLGQHCPLPSRELLVALTETQLLDRYLQRHLYNALVASQAAALEDGAEPTPAETPSPAGPVEGFGSWAEFASWCDLLEVDSRRLIQFGEELDSVSETIWGAMVPSHFLKHRSDYDQVVLDVVRISDPDLATELFFQLDEGERSFPELVSHYGQPQDRQTNGRIGPILVRQLNPLLERVVRRYSPGELIPPLDVNGRVHLMRIESLEPARLEPQLHRQIVQQLRHDWLEAQLRLLRQRLQEALAE